MAYHLIYLILAAFGLGVLIFIHELGHYWMARREGMTVEAFSIGFGKPIYSWERDGVKWQLCWLFFGGYVRIAGMEKKGALEPYEIPDGFYGKKPLSRIKVALAGPIVNIIFAFLAFVGIWMMGGRLKPFSEYTHIIGWVDPCSALHNAGIDQGDVIEKLNGKPFKGFNDILYATMLENKAPEIAGSKVDYFSNQKTPFDFRFPFDSKLEGAERIGAVAGSMAPSSFLMYKPYPNGKENPLAPGSPMLGSGIHYGDRILWADGEVIFSRQQLISTINEQKVLLTIKRGSETLLMRVPRLKISDLKLTAVQRAELADWQHESQVKGKVSDLFFVPYHISPQLVVNGSLLFLNEETLEQGPIGKPRCQMETPLLQNDQIIAVDGVMVATPTEALKQLQSRQIQVIVKRGKEPVRLSWKDADSAFVNDFEWNSLKEIIASIGTGKAISDKGSLHLLHPIIPKPLNDFHLNESMRTRLANELSAKKQAIDEIDDPKSKEAALRILDENHNKVMLGIILQDETVNYNPSPFVLFGNVFHETWRTLAALVTGVLSPKWMQGPVGIVQVMQNSWSLGLNEALFWMGMISLNLGFLNLLPVPVLDGGHICFAIYEQITKRKIKAKTMERLIIPFVVLLIAFFVYVTYHDLVRLLGGFFK